jgi:hypothetical protein
MFSKTTHYRRVLSHYRVARFKTPLYGQVLTSLSNGSSH